MNLFRRIRHVLRSRFMEHFGDAESVLEEAIIRLDEHLAEARGLLTCSEEEGRRLVDLMNGEQQLEQRMLARAKSALHAGQDALAGEAMKRCLRARRQSKQYYRMWEQQQIGIARTQTLLEQLEEKRADADRRRQQLLMRRHLARARRVLAETLYGERGRGQVERAEEEMINEELTAESYQELILASPYLPPDLFDEQISGDSVKKALQDLRSELGLPAPEGESRGLSP